MRSIDLTVIVKNRGQIHDLPLDKINYYPERADPLQFTAEIVICPEFLSQRIRMLHVLFNVL